MIGCLPFVVSAEGQLERKMAEEERETAVKQEGESGMEHSLLIDNKRGLRRFRVD